jgi:hypothetical protein
LRQNQFRQPKPEHPEEVVLAGQVDYQRLPELDQYCFRPLWYWQFVVVVMGLAGQAGY